MTMLILARHGETDWNRDGIWQGHGDPPLNAAGRAQAADLGVRLRESVIDAIYASDLKRAVETAGVVATSLAMPVTLDAGLREMDVGSWTGLTTDQIVERYPTMEGHDGEPYDVFQRRVLAACAAIGDAHEGRRVLVVTHGGVVRALQRHMLGEPLPVLENCATTGVRYEGGTFSAVD